MKVLRRFLIGWFVLLLVSGTVIWVFYRIQVKAHFAETEASERLKARSAVQAITGDLSGVGSDLLYLADQPLLHQWLATNRPNELHQLAHDYLAFVRYRSIYDQVRIIDTEGREVVRVNWNNGNPIVVPKSKLQDKSGRYYVQKGLALKDGQVYVSHFDLNIEHGQIERPLKPMLRVVTPVFDRQGLKRGIIVLNVLGQRILDRLKKLASTRNGNIWLVNAQGYWLQGSQAKEDWGFMLAGRSNSTLTERYPKVWARIISAGGIGQTMSERGLFTYRAIVPKRALLRGGHSVAVGKSRHQRWYVVAYLPTGALSAYSERLAKRLGWGYAALASIFALVAWIVAYLTVQHSEAERAVQKARARYQDLVNNLGVGVYRITAGPDATFEEVNPAMVTLFAAENRDQLLATPVRDLYVDPTQSAVLSQKPARPDTVIKAELQLRRLDGEHFWASMTKVKKTENTDHAYFDGVLIDITERKRAADALHASESRFRALLDAAPDAVIIAAQDGSIVLANDQVKSLFGYQQNELVGQPIEILVPDRFRNRHKAHRSKYLAAPVTRPMGTGLDLWGRRKDGSEFPVAISLSPVKTDQGLLIFTDIRDVTAEHQAEQNIQTLNSQLLQQNRELEAVNKELEAFSYSVSHDLRAPLRAIDGFSHILQDDFHDQLEPTAQDYLARVRRAAQRMGVLIDDLLTLSRITRSDLAREIVDLSELAWAVVNELQHAESGRQVEIEIAPEMEARGDPRLLRVLLENLFENAWKFTANRDPAKISFTSESRNQETIFQISDNGAGFDMAYAYKLFGAFQRLHNATEYPGTGIGLATVQRIVHKHGGRIWAEAETGKGATFFFTIPQFKEAS